MKSRLEQANKRKGKKIESSKKIEPQEDIILKTKIEKLRDKKKNKKDADELSKKMEKNMVDQKILMEQEIKKNKDKKKDLKLFD